MSDPNSVGTSHASPLPERPLKIGFIVPGFSSDESDWCIPALLNTVRVLAQRHEVHVFTLRYPHRHDTYTVYGATVHALGGATASGLRRVPLLARAIQKVVIVGTRHVVSAQYPQQSRKFDILHALWADEPGFVAITAGRLLRVPVIVSLLGGELIDLPQIHYGHQRSRAARRMIDHSLRRADLVTVGSQTLHERANPFMRTICDNHRRIPSRRFTPLSPGGGGAGGERGVPPLKIAPLGVDTTLFSPDDTTGPQRAASLRGGFKLLHTASLEPIKNQAMLLHTLAEVQRIIPDAHLHIIGDGKLRPELEALTQTLDLNNHVTFHGDIPHDRLPDYYRAADLCVVTSFYESQSMVALEAGACGKATIGTRVGILPELIPEQYLVHPIPPPLHTVSDDNSKEFRKGGDSVGAQRAAPLPETTFDKNHLYMTRGSAGDVSSLANIIITLARDAAQRAELNRHAYQQVQARYTLDACVTTWEQFYREMGTI